MIKFDAKDAISLKKMGDIACVDAHNNPGQAQDSIGTKYNKCVEAYRQNGLNDDDIIVFCHEDVIITDPNFSQKMQVLFNTKPDVGMVGVGGGTVLPENMNWFMQGQETIRGQWLQEYQGQIAIMKKDNVGYYDDVVVLHKFMFAIRGSLFNQGLKFDENLKQHDLYNVDVGLDVLNMGYKLAVVDILVQHKSSRENNVNHEYIKQKWEEKGKTFPLTVDQFNANIEEAEFVEIDI